MCTNLPLPTKSTIGDEEIEIDAVFICWGSMNRKFSHYKVRRYGNEVWAFYHNDLSMNFTDPNLLTKLLYLGYNLKMNFVLSEVCLLEFIEFTPSKEFR